MKGTFHHTDKLILAHLEKIMATLDEILASVTAESQQISGVATLVAELKAAGTTIASSTQTAIDAVASQVASNQSALTAVTS